MASRMTVRLTPWAAVSLASLGSFSPCENSPFNMELRKIFATLETSVPVALLVGLDCKANDHSFYSRYKGLDSGLFIFQTEHSQDDYYSL